MVKARKASFLFCFLAACFLSSCGIYVKTYRFDNKAIDYGMDQQSVVGILGNPLLIRNVDFQQVWQYLEADGNTYYWVWFQDGKVIKWGKEESF